MEPSLPTKSPKQISPSLNTIPSFLSSSSFSPKSIYLSSNPPFFFFIFPKSKPLLSSLHLSISSSYVVKAHAHVCRRPGGGRVKSRKRGRRERATWRPSEEQEKREEREGQVVWLKKSSGGIYLSIFVKALLIIGIDD